LKASVTLERRAEFESIYTS